MKKSIINWMPLLAACAFAACSNGLDDIMDMGYDRNDAGFTLSAPTVASSTGNSITVSSTISGGQPAWVGFCYSTTSQSPTINDDTVHVEAASPLTHTFANLRNGTTYFIRAFGYGNSRYVYSETLVARTADLPLDEQLANYVAPDYPDDYTSISSWSYRRQWNLANVHDPSVVLAEDGYYYMYQTDASYGNAHVAGGHFHGRRSQNLVDWEYLGGTMQDIPAWVKDSLNSYRAVMGLDPIDNPSYGYWAPVVRKVRDGLYRMYYSIVVDNYIKTGAANTTANFDNSWTERAFIGMMETTDPASNVWEDKGFVICSSSNKAMNAWTRSSANNWDAYFNFNAIDPTYIVTPEGEHWMIYGSWHNGIAAIQINPETGKTLNALPYPWAINDNSYGRRIATRNISSRWQGSEGPEIVYRGGYYYLFLAYDGLDVPYNTRVVRSTSITGPYYDITGTDVTNRGGEMLPVVTHPYKFNDSYGWVGISHCAVFDDGNDNWYFASQARFPANVGGNSYSNAIMLGHVRSLRWTDEGWPVVMPERYGAVPQLEIADSEIAGNWEVIDLSYSYQNMKTSVSMVLGEDHTVTSGMWAGSTWSFDAANNVLTIGGTKLYVQREVDWEASPRKHTIVFAGIGSNNVTYWGKRN